MPNHRPSPIAPRRLAVSADAFLAFLIVITHLLQRWGEPQRSRRSLSTRSNSRAGCQRCCATRWFAGGYIRSTQRTWLVSLYARGHKRVGFTYRWNAFPTASDSRSEARKPLLPLSSRSSPGRTTARGGAYAVRNPYRLAPCRPLFSKFIPVGVVVARSLLDIGPNCVSWITRAASHHTRGRRKSRWHRRGSISEGVTP